MSTVCVVDYGVGNIHSAMKGLKRFTNDVVLSEDPAVVHSASALVLPGQGAFETGMHGLRIRGLLEVVQSAASAGKPILGICLGAQLLLERGFEFGEWEGLGLIEGNVVRFPPLQEEEKIPHMGWNSIAEPQEGAWVNTALQEVPSGAEMYFIHSYILQPKHAENVISWSKYGGLRFASAIQKGRILGCQFHPEKSGDIGLTILKKFVEMT